MILNFGNVTLRAIEMRDKELLLYLVNDPNTEKMTGGWNHPVSEHAQEEWMREYRFSDDAMRWVAENRNNRVAFGLITLSDIDWKNRCAFIHYKANAMETRREKGDMKDAVYAAVQYAFDELGMHRIEGLVLEQNIFSKKLLQSFGFVKEGTYRSRIFKEGRWHDQELYGLLNEEFVRYKNGEAPWQI